MKKLLLAAVFCASALFSANAQIERGALSVGGTVNIASSTNKYDDGSSTVDGPKYTNLTFGPQAAYFITDQFSIGAALVFDRQVSKRDYVGTEIKEISNLFLFSPVGRYHVGLGEKFYAYGEARFSVGFGGSKAEADDNSTDTGDVNVLGFSLSPGIVFFPGERVGIELSVNLLTINRRVDKDSDEDKEISTNFSFGPDLFMPTLGVQLYF